MSTRNELMPFPRSSVLVLSVVLTGAFLSPPAFGMDDDEPSFSKLAQQMQTAHRNGKYEKSLELSEKMHEMRPDDKGPVYNIACAHCLLGDKEKAYTWLEKAIDKGYSDADHMTNDYDLRTIRGEPRFRKMLRQLRDKKRKPGKQAGERDAAPPEPKAKPPEMTGEERQAKIGELTRKLMEAAGAGRNEKALEYAEQALEVGDTGLTNYNVACMHSLLGHEDKAFKYLNIAVEKGMGRTLMVDQIEGDADFKNIREDSRYKDILEKARKSDKRRAAPDRPEEKDVKASFKITLPDDFDKSKKAPLIVALHHYHGNMGRTIDRWKDAADEVGAILLTPQGTVEMGGNQYHWGDDLDTIEDNVLDAIDDVMDEYKVDSHKVVLGGFSQGGWATWGLALRNPDLFAGIIPVCGRFEPESESALGRDGLEKLRVFIMLGADLREQVIDGNKDAARRLRKIGAKVKTNVYEGIGHSFPEDRTRELVKALRFVFDD
ncbi:MAG: dienelactone hydrolase family protein [Planctomycetota bacterium]|nr:dienelactone hydrolase family protein [Planctomycetota bacterium]